MALAPVAGHSRSDRVPISANGPERINTAKCKLSFVPQNNHERVSPKVCRIPDRQCRTRDDARAVGAFGFLTRVGLSPDLERCEKGPVLIAFYQSPRTPVSAPVETWAGLGKVLQLLAPTCASRLTRMRPVADPRGAAARMRPVGQGWRAGCITRRLRSLRIPPLCFALLLRPRLLASPARPPC